MGWLRGRPVERTMECLRKLLVGNIRRGADVGGEKEGSA